MSPRKRRREQAFPDEETDTQAIPNEDESDRRRAEKEQEVWDAVREAHYEAIEQLPLTLHRQLSLMRQLDEQTLACTASLLPALQIYIKERRAMAGVCEKQAAPIEEETSIANPDESDGPSLHPPISQSNGPTKGNDNFTTIASPSKPLRNGVSRSPPRTPAQGSGPESLKPPETAREQLSHVAFMAEELLRASQEKVNLAQANHDSVERHIRLLDQAIKEQEAALSADQSRSSNGVVVHLPELIVPKWRNSRSEHALGNELDVMNGDPDISSFRIDEDHSAVSHLSAAKRKKGLHTGPDKYATEPDEQGKKTSLTITLPATQLSEELYCYCNRVSFGDMIACDGESCDREWFHLGCVGLTEVPEGEWYCEDCRVDEL